MGIDTQLGAGGTNLGLPAVAGANGVNLQSILANTQPGGMPGFSNPMVDITGQQGPMLSSTQALWQMISMLMQKVDALMKANPSAAQAEGSGGPTPGNQGSATALPGGVGGSSCPDGSCNRNNAGGNPFSGAQVAQGGRRGRSGCGGNNCGGGTGCNGCGRQGGSLARGGSSGITPVNNAQANGQLNQALTAIAQDPEGRKLLAGAQARGVKIRVGQFNQGNLLGQFDPNTNTITISAKNPGSIKTITHELVHANTPEDGDSQTEEASANVVGDRVESRLRGRAPRDPNAIVQETLPLYPKLKADNGILQTLPRLLANG